MRISYLVVGVVILGIMLDIGYSSELYCEFVNGTNIADIYANSSCANGSINNTLICNQVVPPWLSCVNNNISTISINSSFVNGTISSNINTFTALRSLEMINTSINQSIATVFSYISTLSSLTYLDLSMSKFSGALPSGPLYYTKLTAIDHLDLSSTRISGSIPTVIADLTALSYLDLSFTQLSGSFPTVITQLIALRYLDLSFTQLSGALPCEIGYLTLLQFLSFENCSFSGQIPTEISLLSQLEYLNFQGTKLNSCPPDGTTFNATCLFPTGSPCLTKISCLNSPGNPVQVIEGYTNLNTSILGELYVTFNGTLVITGPIVVTGFLSADGSLDITNGGLTVDGNLYLNTTSILRLAEGSIVNITGCASVGGSKVELTYTPTPNKPITVLIAPCINGSFSDVIFPDSNDCPNYKWAQSGTYLTLVYLGCEPSNLFPAWGWIIIAIVVALFIIGAIVFCYHRWDAILETKAFIKKLRELD